MKEDNLLIKKQEDKINSEKFKRFFFLEFTKELIRNYSPEDILKLKEILEKERELKFRQEKTKTKVKDIIESKEKREEQIIEEMRPSITKSKNLSFALSEEQPRIFSAHKKTEKAIPQKERRTENINPFKELRLIIPETKFPPHLQYIRPVKMNKELDLGKLNPFIQDFAVKIIECYGSEQNLLVRGNMGVKKTGLILTKEEITEIIKKFSEETKIPVHEGIFKVVAGKLIFLAIISDILGSKFIIRKMGEEERANYKVPLQHTFK